MRIVLINTYHYNRGGDCTYMFSLADLLRSRGHDVFFFGMKHPLNFPCEQEKYFVDYVDFRELNSKKNLVNNVRVLSRSIYSVQARSNIARLISDLKPDISHIQNIHAHITPSIVFELQKQRVPIIWTLHDYKLVCPNTHFLSHGQICEKCKGGKFYHCTLKKCKKDSYAASLVATAEAYVHSLAKVTNKVDAFISPSAFLRQKFLENGYDSKKFFHVPNFLHDDLPENVKSIDGGYALYLGQLEPWKGIRTLVRAWSDLKGITLKIAGDGSLKTELEKEIAESRTQNILFLGHLGRKSVWEVLSKSSFVVTPSEWYENYPYSVMETMMCGKPIVASNIGGLPEMIRDGETGLLFESGNIGALKGKLEILLKNVQLRKEMGEKGREMAVREFSPEIHYAKLMKIYEDAVSTKFRRGR